MQMGGSPPETFVSIFCMQNASLSRADKSLELASAQRNSGVAAAARQMRRFFGPMGSVARQDVLAATDVEGRAKTARAAYGEPKKNLTKKGRGGNKRGQSGKVKGGGETFNGIYPKEGIGGRRFFFSPGYRSQGLTQTLVPTLSL